MSFLSPSFANHTAVKIGNVALGQAPVKIISSICAANAAEMLEQAKAIEASCADIIEWRADYFDENTPWPDAVKAIKKVVTKPMIFTLRTHSEGGVRKTPMSDSSYRKEVFAAIESGLFEAVDIEYLRDRAYTLIDAADKAGIVSIASWHDFTPGHYDSEIGYIGHISRMAQMLPDIIKLAVMPLEGLDISRFMEEVSFALTETPFPQPVIAMCMGKAGAITRIGASAFGSCATFASVGKTSAPGQLDAETTRKLLDLFLDEPKHNDAASEA